jgi:phospholipid N-methyltransferase
MIFQERLSFFRNAVDDPNVGALTMSSSYVVRAVLRSLPPGATTIVEHGPGTGVLTRLLLHHLPPEGRLFAIERSPAFVDRLSRMGDPRLHVVTQSSEELHYDALGIDGRIDAVVASIPFSFVAPDDRRTIVGRAYGALRPGGVLAVFHQYSLLMRAYLRERFDSVRFSFEPRNLFPCFILHATKQEAVLAAGIRFTRHSSAARSLPK